MSKSEVLTFLFNYVPGKAVKPDRERKLSGLKILIIGDYRVISEGEEGVPHAVTSAFTSIASKPIVNLYR